MLIYQTAGFVSAMTGDPVALGWQRVFKLSWVVGFLGGALVYYLISLVSPPPGAPYVMEYLDGEGVIEASPGSDEEVATSSIVAEKK